MRIAFLASHETGNGFYRGVAPMAALEARGHRVIRLGTDERDVPVGAVRDVDVLHIHRFCDARALALARAAAAAGAVVVWDNDDDTGSLPRGSTLHRRFGGIQWERRRAAMGRLFRVVDLVTAPSATLAARLGDVGARRTAVIENYVPEAFLRRSGRPHRHVVIGWTAGLEHQLDVERIPIRETLQRLLDDCPDVAVHTFGLKLGLRSDRCSNTDVVPLMELTEAASAFDVGIAPIADIPLNQARSSVKVKEYAAAGVPWLASPIGPYAGLGEKQGGRLVADDRWYEELRRLVDRARERRKLQKRAVKWIAGETLERNAHRWEELLADAVARAARERGAPA